MKIDDFDEELTKPDLGMRFRCPVCEGSGEQLIEGERRICGFCFGDQYITRARFESWKAAARRWGSEND